MAVPTATQSVTIGKSDSTKSSGRQFLGDTGPFTNSVSSDFIDSDFRHSPSMAIVPVVTPSVVTLEGAACLAGQGVGGIHRVGLQQSADLIQRSEDRT